MAKVQSGRKVVLCLRKSLKVLKMNGKSENGMGCPEDVWDVLKMYGMS